MRKIMAVGLCFVLAGCSSETFIGHRQKNVDTPMGVMRTAQKVIQTRTNYGFLIGYREIKTVVGFNERTDGGIAFGVWPLSGETEAKNPIDMSLIEKAM